MSDAALRAILTGPIDPESPELSRGFEQQSLRLQRQPQEFAVLTRRQKAPMRDRKPAIAVAGFARGRMLTCAGLITIDRGLGQFSGGR